MVTYEEAPTYGLFSQQEVMDVRWPQIAGLRVTKNFGMLNSSPFPMSSNRSYNLVSGSNMPGPVLSTSLKRGCMTHQFTRLEDGFHTWVTALSVLTTTPKAPRLGERK